MVENTSGFWTYPFLLAALLIRGVSADIDPRSLVRCQSCSSNADGNAQEVGGDQGSAIRAFVFCIRQLHQLGVEIVYPSALLGCLYGVHGRAVASFKEVNKVCRGLVGRDEVVSILDHGYFVARHAGLDEPLDDVCFDAPGDGTDEAFRRRRHERSADLEQLRDESRIAWDPVGHDDAAARFCDAHHFFCDVEGLRREHGAEQGYGHVEGMNVYSFQVGGIAFLELQAGETGRCGSPVPGIDEFSGDIDSDDFRAKLGQGKRSCVIPQPRSKIRSGDVSSKDLANASPD